jgi:hypothetical protein
MLALGTLGLIVLMMERRREPSPGALWVLFGARTRQREAASHSRMMRPGSTVYRK